MSEIVGSLVPRHQPRGPVRINPAWRSRLLSLVYFGGGGPVDLVDRKAGYAYGGSAKLGAGGRGIGLQTGAGAVDYIESTNALADYSGPVTVITHFLAIDAAQDANGFVWWGIPAASSYNQINNTGDAFVAAFGANLNIPLGESVLGTQNRTLIFNSAGNKLYLDRKLVHTNYASGTVPAGAKTVRIGAWSSAGFSFKGVIGSIAVIRGDISHAEALAWVDNPWIAYIDSTQGLEYLPVQPPPATGSTTINEHATWRVFEGAAGSRSITFSGTQAGGIDDVQVQIETVGGAAVVPWTTVATAVADGGAWSGALTVPRGGWYVAKARRANDVGAVSTQAQKWGVGIILGGFGQSQLVGFLTGGTATPDARAVIHDGTNWQQMPGTGNGQNTFAATLAATCNCPVAVIGSAFGGTAISLWWSGGAKTTSYNDWEAKVTAAGGKLSAFLLWQGEGDANIQRTKAAYKADIDAIFAQLRTDYGAGLPVVIAALGRYSGAITPPLDADYEAIRDAHIDAANDTGNLGFNTYDMALADDAHFNTPSLNILANRLAQCVAKAYGDASYSQGPRIVSATRAGANIVDVNLVHDGGTDFTPASGITGFAVLDNGSPVTISSAARVSATKIRLTLASTPTGTVTVRYMYGKNPTVTGAVLDNSGLTLPLATPDADITAYGRRVQLNCIQRVGGAAAASVTGLRWAFFDQPLPNNFAAPAAQGIGESTDGSGALDIDVTGTNLNIGDVGFLVVSNTDGTMSDSTGFACPVTVSG